MALHCAWSAGRPDPHRRRRGGRDRQRRRYDAQLVRFARRGRDRLDGDRRDHDVLPDRGAGRVREVPRAAPQQRALRRHRPARRRHDPRCRRREVDELADRAARQGAARRLDVVDASLSDMESMQPTVVWGGRVSLAAGVVSVLLLLGSLTTTARSVDADELAGTSAVTMGLVVVAAIGAFVIGAWMPHAKRSDEAMLLVAALVVLVVAIFALVNILRVLFGVASAVEARGGAAESPAAPVRSQRAESPAVDDGRNASRVQYRRSPRLCQHTACPAQTPSCRRTVSSPRRSGTVTRWHREVPSAPRDVPRVGSRQGRHRLARGAVSISSRPRTKTSATSAATGGCSRSGGGTGGASTIWSPRGSRHAGLIRRRRDALSISDVGSGACS